jgi:hypothetical protein
MQWNLRGGKHGGEIFRQRGGDEQRLAAGGMFQTELKGVEEEPTGEKRLFEHTILLEGAIHIIADKREMPRGGLDADLMRFAGDEVDLDQREAMRGAVMEQAIAQLGIRSRPAPHRRAHLMPRMLGDEVIEPHAFGFQAATAAEGEVFFAHLLGLEGLAALVGRLLGFGCERMPWGLFTTMRCRSSCRTGQVVMAGALFTAAGFRVMRTAGLPNQIRRPVACAKVDSTRGRIVSSKSPESVNTLRKDDSLKTPVFLRPTGLLTPQDL